MSCPDGLDRIELRGITARGRHGLFEFERENGQIFVVDATLGLDLTEAATTHDLGKTVDYGELSARIHDAIASDPVDLIETLALRMVDLCMEHGPVQWVSVTVHKPEAPIAVTFTDVTVTIERSRT